MIYLDTSVILAELFAEDRSPAPDLFDGPLVSSRLLEYEVWNRVHARGLADSHAEPAREILARIAFLELQQPVLLRALEPFPRPVRTLHALHLASADFLRSRDPSVRVATYDRVLAEAAASIGIPAFEP